MTLTESAIEFARKKLNKELRKIQVMRFSVPDVRQAIIDAEAWAETGSVKNDFNNNLTAGNFKTNATADEKRLVLIFALLAIVEG